METTVTEQDTMVIHNLAIIGFGLHNRNIAAKLNIIVAVIKFVLINTLI